GSDLTHYLAKPLSERGYSFTTPAELEIVHEGEAWLDGESLDYIPESMDVKEQEEKSMPTRSWEEHPYRLPDGQVITLESERFYVLEALFQPSLLGLEEPGLHTIVHESIMETDIFLHDFMFKNIVFSGGTTLFYGLAARLEKELEALASPTPKIRQVRTMNITASVTAAAFTGGLVMELLAFVG
ncbi:MAG: beta-actin, partial [Benniella sp.]